MYPTPLHCNQNLEAHLAQTALSAILKAKAKPAPIHRITESCAKSVKILRDFVDGKEFTIR